MNAEQTLSASDDPYADRRERALEAVNAEDRARATAFGAGIAVGALLGAGLALLLAPQSGRATRAIITGRARRFETQARDSWADLGDELRAALRRGRRHVRRGARRARWHAADAVEG